MGAVNEAAPKPCKARTCDKGMLGLYTPGGQKLRDYFPGELPPACRDCPIREMNLYDFQWTSEAQRYWRDYIMCSRINPLTGLIELWTWPFGGGLYDQPTDYFTAFQLITECVSGRGSNQNS